MKTAMILLFALLIYIVATYPAKAAETTPLGFRTDIHMTGKIFTLLESNPLQPGGHERKFYDIEPDPEVEGYTAVQVCFEALDSPSSMSVGLKNMDDPSAKSYYFWTAVNRFNLCQNFDFSEFPIHGKHKLQLDVFCHDNRRKPLGPISCYGYVNFIFPKMGSMPM